MIARLRAAMDAAGTRPADGARAQEGTDPGDSGAAPKGLDDDPAGVPDDVDPAALSKAMAYLTRSASRRPGPSAGGDLPLYGGAPPRRAASAPLAACGQRARRRVQLAPGTIHSKLHVRLLSTQLEIQK